MFLGKLIKSAGRAVRNFANSSIGRGIGSALKSVGKTVLPLAGKALGSFVGGPIGGMIGGKLGSAASNLFELELEGLSPEDQEFETARAFVRFANSAARRGASIQRQRPGIQPRTAVRTALGQAARQHAPGLLRTPGSAQTRDARGRFSQAQAPGRRPSGTRRGARIPYGGPGIGPNFSNYNFGGSNLNQGDYDATNGADDYGADDVQAAQRPTPAQRPTQGTWQRQGRTLIIQL
jgi:hypothetical protein